MKQDIQYYW